MIEHKIHGLELVCAKEDRGELYWALMKTAIRLEDNPTYNHLSDIENMKCEFNLTDLEMRLNWYRTQLYLIDEPEQMDKNRKLYKHGPPLYYISEKNG